MRKPTRENTRIEGPAEYKIQFACKSYEGKVADTMGSHSHGKDKIDQVLKQSLELEEDLMRTYLITAERVHEDQELKERLENFAEGNAKRTKQLLDELNK